MELGVKMHEAPQDRAVMDFVLMNGAERETMSVQETQSEQDSWDQRVQFQQNR